MVMNEKDIDKFLLSHKVEIEDKGFTDRVMQSLPAHLEWQRRMYRIWNVLCIVMLAVFCWQTDVLNKLMVDIEVFTNNLPLMLNDASIWTTIAVLAIGLYTLVLLGGKKLASL